MALVLLVSVMLVLAASSVVDSRAMSEGGRVSM
jgi:hypothetical protein